MWNIPNWLKPWPTSPRGQQILNLTLAWLWFAFGMIGLADFVGWIDVPGEKLAKSIPVLFAISVYANFVGHLSTAQAARAEDGSSNAS